MLAVHEASTLLEGATLAGDLRIVVQALEGWDAAGLKAIAAALVSQKDVAVCLLSMSDPVAVVVARSQNVVIDAAKTLRALLDRFGGRGGGRPDLAQGAGLIGKVDEILAAARDRL
jgi:alanyl-tRNA synthetase